MKCFSLDLGIFAERNRILNATGKFSEREFLALLRVVINQPVGNSYRFISQKAGERYGSTA